MSTSIFENAYNEYLASLSAQQAMECDKMIPDPVLYAAYDLTSAKYRLMIEAPAIQPDQIAMKLRAALVENGGTIDRVDAVFIIADLERMAA